MIWVENCVMVVIDVKSSAELVKGAVLKLVTQINVHKCKTMMNLGKQLNQAET